jgi:hypothetical protein
MKEFVRPIFDGKCLEFRYTNDEICIYGNPEGMKKLSDFCLQLANIVRNHETEHIHLGDYDILTSSSLRGTIAVFKD